MTERPQVAVFAPSPVLTITVEGSPAREDEIHLHAGGQGFWVARLAANLGAEVTLCAALGGESGRVLAELIASHGVLLRAVAGARPNGAYIHDRRSGERKPVAAVRSPELQRHEVDELFGGMTAAALSSQVAVLTGCEHERVVPSDVYRRLASDLRRNGVPVIADLTGAALEAALAGGLDLLKLSHDELGQMVSRPLDCDDRFVEEIAGLRERGAENVLISRAERPALASVGGDLLELSGPRFEPLDHHGAGDSMVAAVAVGVARGLDLHTVLRMAVAAGALNVTRRGLGSGERGDIERMAGAVRLRPVVAQAR
ncbi:MAG TPA: PfkB family carbohydrate kinase [Thermoleophilaceae bacterium]|nr:PfkB family carbohydrate kinase [Thermoleophilaceae bacterium]